jgi:hypothetical protein
MALDEPSKGHVPGIFGGDLPEKEQLAFEEGHDADIPSNEGVVSHKDALKKQESGDGDKTDKHDHSSNNSEAGDGDLEKGQPAEITATEAEPQDPNIVDWEGPDDPENPLNWSASKKWSNIAMLSFLTFLIPLASSMFAPGVPDVIRDFHTTK